MWGHLSRWLSASQEGLPQKSALPDLDLGLLTSKTEKINFYSLSRCLPSSLRYFVMAAWADSYSAFKKRRLWLIIFMDVFWEPPFLKQSLKNPHIHRYLYYGCSHTYLRVYSPQTQYKLCKISKLITKQTTIYLVLPLCSSCFRVSPSNYYPFLKGHNKMFIVDSTGTSTPQRSKYSMPISRHVGGTFM